MNNTHTVTYEWALFEQPEDIQVARGMAPTIDTAKTAAAAYRNLWIDEFADVRLVIYRTWKEEVESQRDPGVVYTGVINSDGSDDAADAADAAAISEE